ncbi:MAG: hypothetical protein JXA69_00660 [Phycisphaerae bacterium]|nr:hypothetical protein [Phycisphaerae bacterium]
MRICLYRHTGIILLTASAFAAGCGPTGGAFAYFFGPTPKHTIEAKFTLSPGPLLILVDDSAALDLPPQLREFVLRALIDEFRRAGINEQVVPPSRFNEMRRSQRDLDKRGIREVGRMFDVDQVLWVHPRAFSMSDQPENALDPAKVTVALKVINARAEQREAVRVWPVSEEGELVSISLAPHEVRAAGTPDALIRKMAETLAAEIGLLFHKHVLTR